ncbi:MAG: acetyl-CoA acetyltransferase family protein [Ilumatobacter sp.]|jgi:acetyl-CoA C-acetyltransferase
MTSFNKDVCLAGGMRTALGNFGGSLRDTTLTDMSGHAARATLAAAGADPESIDHMIFATTCPNEQDTLYAARVAGVKSGIPEAAPALLVSRACGSGLQAMVSAQQMVESGHSALALAGGAENFSRAPFVVTTARWGHERGHQQLEDLADWCYQDPFTREYMGETADNLNDEFGYEREAMDEYAVRSQQLAFKAIESGFLAKQITPMEVPDGRGTRIFDVDESPRRDATPEKLARLRPAFREGGQVTAGNSSGVTDGAGFVLVGDRATMEAGGVRPRARIVDWAVTGVPPRIMGHGPVPATEQLMDRTGLSISDIDYFEVNEAFAVVNLHVERHLGIPRDIHNLYGGGISVGHPPGLTGVRMAMNAMQHLEDTEGRYAVLALCMGGGQGKALLLERVVE